MDNTNSGDRSVPLAKCPACGGQNLIIVADDRAHLYELFQQAFAYNETVRVLQDRRVAERRVAERRRRPAPGAPDRRRGDRRSALAIDDLLLSTGWAIVPPGCPGAESGLCPLVLSGAGKGTSLLAAAGPARTAEGRPFVSRHLLGIVVLLLTMVPGYLASRTTGAHATPHASHAPEGEDTASDMEIDSLISAVAGRYGVSEELIAAIIEAESEFNPRAVSRTGARGLMQLMPKTAAILGVGDPFDPRENIEGGVRHLRSLMDRFDGNLPLVLAAYNAGDRAVIRHGGVPPYRETRRYVNRILRRLHGDAAKTSESGHRGRKAVG